MTTPTIVATPGSATANSYCTKAEADTYFNERLPIVPPWEDAETPEAALIMACRVLDAALRPQRTYVPPAAGHDAYYRMRRTWSGSPATTTQKLAWPRTGMKDQNGNVIDSAIIPDALKEAQSEFAGQLIKGDRTLDNDVLVQGITSLRAGPVSLSFKDSGIFAQVLPDAVYDLMPSSWFLDEQIMPAYTAEFNVI
jgi:hypothetical protein